MLFHARRHFTHKAPFTNPGKNFILIKKTLAAKASGFYGADDGNRTRVTGLGSECSAIELRLRDGSIIAQRTAFVNTFSDGDAD